MKFNNSIAKLIVRYTKETGQYKNFKIYLKKYITKLNIKEEKELYTQLAFRSPIFMLNRIGMPYETEYMSDSQMYVFKNKEQEIITLFENFLKKRKIYREFFKNIDPKFVKKYDSHTKYIQEFNEKDKKISKKKILYSHIIPNAFIMNAFYWEKTLEGRQFWQEINYEWENIFINYINSIK